MTTRVAVIDIGKTNAKLALVDLSDLAEIAVVTRPNAVRPGPPWPHFDLDGHWDFLLDALGQFHAAQGIDAISVTTHGAAAVLLDAKGALAAPMLDYEHDGPEATAFDYEAIRPPFAETGSPRLPAGLNLGAQLHWQLQDPELNARVAHVVTYPQYWGYRLTGQLASDVTSLGCHTDLWAPFAGRASTLVDRLGLAGRLAPARISSEVLGPITREIAARTGLPAGTPVTCGIHDSNASLYPHLAGRAAPFSVVSTGTWVIAMAVGGAETTLDPARDTLVNVNAKGDPVPSARFMGGREFELLRPGTAPAITQADRDEVLSGLFIRPGTVPGTGPFPDHEGGFTKEPVTEGARMLALSWYLALMTDTCLSLIGAQGPVIVEGPFARNDDYLAMLGALRGEVEASASATGTSVGSALLVAPGPKRPAGRRIARGDAKPLRTYAETWRRMMETS
ncbi:carbohydrate kinase [Salipiger sp. IMCC34102]|uniref:FGGY-family carbohydrate kinase n=1 Tax=Salipiger sp. IMCC34102 TaxID=2510647 RepID=UPI00101D1D11|nr:FGGY-family carbohydrate kinase [Salipiger sp. IMCC34102]RYH02663.1 carbohydrate kinase [Salipiger sp. IMCC34102]